jgi:phosphomannomutase
MLQEIETLYSGKESITLDSLDGLTVSSENWWFNLRASNTEPLLRLNVEAKTQARLDRVTKEVLDLIA